MDTRDTDSVLASETALKWGFLEEESEPCAVVSKRMELVYTNRAARELIPEHWFGRRCFEVFPTVDEKCALKCPTISAVRDSEAVAYGEEKLRLESGAEVELGVGIIPLAPGGRSRAVLLLRQKNDVCDGEEFETKLLSVASELRERLGEHGVH